MARYKYTDAHDWLEERITGTSDLDYLRGIIRALAGKCDGDDMQELFQREMSDDGYFTDLDAEEEGDGGEVCIITEDDDHDGDMFWFAEDDR